MYNFVNLINSKNIITKKLHLKNSGEKLITVSTKILGSTIVSKIIEKFFKQQISKLEWFLKDHVSNGAENSALLHRNKLHFKIYSNRKQSL